MRAAGAPLAAALARTGMSQRAWAAQHGFSGSTIGYAVAGLYPLIPPRIITELGLTDSEERRLALDYALWRRAHRAQQRESGRWSKLYRELSSPWDLVADAGGLLPLCKALLVSPGPAREFLIRRNGSIPDQLWDALHECGFPVTDWADWIDELEVA